MRKLILLFSCIALTCNAPLFASHDDDGKTQSEVKIHLKNLKPGRERSGVACADAILDTSTNTVEVSLLNTGSGEIMIIDSSQDIVESISVYGMESCLTLYAPSQEGHYVLIIACEKFYGEGEFLIQTL